MGYLIKVEKDGDTIAEREASPDMVIALLAQIATNNPVESIPDTAVEKRARACAKCGRSGKHASTCPRAAVVNKSKALADDILSFHSEKEKRRQHPETARIEEMLIAGEGVPSILEKVEVSSPTVYVIKARLRKEGKIA